jgi:hypothetical protein
MEPVNKTIPVPRPPPVHREKRRRDAEKPQDPSDEQVPAKPENTDIDDEHTLDEYA